MRIAAGGSPVSRPSGKPLLRVLIRAVPLGEWSENNPRRPTCASFIRDAERKSQASHDIVRKVFDLTPTNTALALALVDGQTLEEAADALAIGKHTARSHLRAIFSETGVTRQATLVRTLLNSVPSLGRGAWPSSRRRTHRVAIVYHRRFPICLIALRSSALPRANDPHRAFHFA